VPAPDDLLDALGEAVRGQLCEVSACTARPVCERNGRALCAFHRDLRDHATSGEPCDRCGSREWIRTVRSTEQVATCAHCGFVVSDESVVTNGW
jgi:hypothetical protein